MSLKDKSMLNQTKQCETLQVATSFELLDTGVTFKRTLQALHNRASGFSTDAVC